MNKTLLALLQAVLPPIMQFLADLIQKLMEQEPPAPPIKRGRPKAPKTAPPSPSLGPLTK
jgi:hypothetical protein